MADEDDDAFDDDHPGDVSVRNGRAKDSGDADTAVLPFVPSSPASTKPKADPPPASITVTMSDGVRKVLRAVGFVLAVILLSAATMYTISAIDPSVLPDGPQGATGATGPQGERGERGRRGAVGRRGKTGAAGANGANGTNGAPGAVVERACSNDLSVPLPYC